MSGEESAALRNFPPAAGKVEEWRGPGTILQDALTGADVSKEDLAHLTTYASLVHAANDPEGEQQENRTGEAQRQPGAKRQRGEGDSGETHDELEGVGYPSCRRRSRGLE